ncbi:hypothetical protein BJF93_14280 [Xaviernesmea oryzae]|uniref:Peptidoglycan binding-like domain-containing protein n=1 Tax=Xaviernesmea oryzae TaxID=464029 RepID=A0A1Q9ARM3_9HYPH|nr:hypothetical protein BJF93_14280 [Xaviernesmea oryzae]
MFLRVLQGIVWLIGRRPATLGGLTLFAVVFAFVAANALWYQPGQHPAPWLRTRLPFTHAQPDRLAALPQEPPKNVTTFLIEREKSGNDKDEAAGSALKPARIAAPDTAAPPAEETAASDPAMTPQPPEQAGDNDLLLRTQQVLKANGAYSGPVDGRSGPRIAAAIRSAQRRLGLTETGQPSEDLLVRLAASPPPGPIVTPRQRPMQNADLSTGGIDPVAAAIRAAEAEPPAASAKPGAAKAQAGKPDPSKPDASKPDGAANSSLVLQIQRGLIHLAYGDVQADGVAGEQTRAAIRHFEKHYRLPETGEPSITVLKKLKAIGAI